MFAVRLLTRNFHTGKEFTLDPACRLNVIVVEKTWVHLGGESALYGSMGNEYYLPSKMR